MMTRLARAAGLSLVFLAGLTHRVSALLNATETADRLVLANDRLFAAVEKSSGAIVSLALDGQDLLGKRSGSKGTGPYLDCYCVPSGFWTPGSEQPSYELYSGTDAAGARYGGVRMSDTYAATGQVLEQYWFLREGETGLHTFSRIAYHNATAPVLRNLQEFRTLLRPNSDMWTHLLANERQHAPLPGAAAIRDQVVVQDATWYLGNTPDDPYVRQESDYFTKYTFQDTWRDHAVHGLFADGSRTPGNATFGAWLVVNTRESYFGGPTRSDLTVDGIVYNYMASNHHGAQTAMIADGFDRTFGPQFYYFNRGPPSSDIHDLRRDAERYADPAWDADFYDSAVARHVPGLVTAAGRAAYWLLRVDLPDGARNPIAVLSENGVDFQDNVGHSDSAQYWASVESDGFATIPRVRAGTYRLTIYADGIFGQYVQDDVVVRAWGDDDDEPHPVRVHWAEERAGNEIFRIGTPDKSSGEFRHGYAPSNSSPLRPEEYRIYWAVYDFADDFPDGVDFRVGRDDPAVDLNYVHWSVLGGPGDPLRPQYYPGRDGQVNNWTVRFDLDESYHRQDGLATFTVQLAAAKTAAGNTDLYNASEPHANLRYTVNVNGKDLEPWIIPYNQSSSCAVRSAVICYNLAHKFEFQTDRLVEGENKLVLSLPYNATNYESAVLTGAIYVQYDALRLEIS